MIYKSYSYLDLTTGVKNGNNLALSPLFVDPNCGDYRLQNESLCRHSADPEPIYNNPDGSRNTMGAYGGPDPL